MFPFLPYAEHIESAFCEDTNKLQLYFYLKEKDYQSDAV